MIVVVMGVAGSGKTTVGTMLAAAMRCPFLEGDSLHPEANVEKMTRGMPLTDADRVPWLAAVHARLLDAFRRGQNLVAGCSALTESSRAALAAGIPITWVYLKGPAELVRSRLEHRTGHFMKADMLDSQFDALEEPSDAITVDVSQPPGAIVEQVMAEVRDPDVRIFADANELSVQAAGAVAATIKEAVRASGRCSLVLAGGHTPRILYSVLASRFRDRIPWADVHVFWGDERYVPHTDARSNYRMAAAALLDHVPCPPANVHPMPTHLSAADAAAREYEATLRGYFADESPHFDLVLLGLGADGHTASLFPASPALHERTRWVVAVTAAAEPPLRLTLTFPALTQSAHTYFLVTGSDKARALQHVLADTADPDTFPAAGIRRRDGTVIWWVDREAAAHLPPRHS